MVGLNARLSPLPRRVLDPLSDFQIRNSLPVSLSVEEQCRPILASSFRPGHRIQRVVPITTKLCVGGLQSFQRRVHRCETTNLLRPWIVLLQHEGDFLSLLQKPAVFFRKKNFPGLKEFSVLENVSIWNSCRLNIVSPSGLFCQGEYAPKDYRKIFLVVGWFHFNYIFIFSLGALISVCCYEYV